MARSKNTWRGTIAGVGVALTTGGAVLMDVAVEHGGTEHPCRIELSAAEASALIGKLTRCTGQVTGLTEESTK